MATRSKINIIKPKTFTDGTICYPIPHALLFYGVSSFEATCYSFAIKDPKWCEAMNLEFDALLKNQTWTLVPSQVTCNVIGCKWVFWIKCHADGSIERYKACLVAKGFHQQPGVDFGKIFSLVVKPTTVHIVLSIVMSLGWITQQINVFKMPFSVAIYLRMYICPNRQDSPTLNIHITFVNWPKLFMG